jgi:hypothetical protein
VPEIEPERFACMADDEWTFRRSSSRRVPDSSTWLPGSGASCPLSTGELNAYEVSALVNSPRNDSSTGSAPIRQK